MVLDINAFPNWEIQQSHTGSSSWFSSAVASASEQTFSALDRIEVDSPENQILSNEQIAQVENLLERFVNSNPYDNLSPLMDYYFNSSESLFTNWRTWEQHCVQLSLKLSTELKEVWINNTIVGAVSGSTWHQLVYVYNGDAPFMLDPSFWYKKLIQKSHVNIIEFPNDFQISIENIFGMPFSIKDSSSLDEASVNSLPSTNDLLIFGENWSNILLSFSNNDITLVNNLSPYNINTKSSEQEVNDFISLIDSFPDTVNKDNLKELIKRHHLYISEDLMLI